MKSNRELPLQSRKVYALKGFTKMKFKVPPCKNNRGSEINNSSSSLLPKIKSLVPWQLSLSTKQDENKGDRQFEDSGKQQTPPTQPSYQKIIFVQRLSNEHFLVGNQIRVDAIGIGLSVDSFIDTDYCWSLFFNAGNNQIQNISVNTKKMLIAILVSSEVQIYSYNFRTVSKEPPTLILKIAVKKAVKFLQFCKDSILGLFYEDNFEIVEVDSDKKTSKKKLCKTYLKPEGSNLFQVPQAIDGTLNVFFKLPKQNSLNFQLWYLELSLNAEQYSVSNPIKVYEISNQLQRRIVLSNYSKSIFCMNLGHEILAVKKGYIIDTINSSMDGHQSTLKYMGGDQLVHVTPRKIQAYQFSIDDSKNPPRIVLQSTDSFYTQEKNENLEFIQILEMCNQNLALFYQQPVKNFNGEIKYAFLLTQKVNFSEKVNSTLPSAEELIKYKIPGEGLISEDDLQRIEERCDMASKMGLTRREIYLHLWEKSTKSDIADYQFLLGTMNYTTIRTEIEKKLKKKSMVLRQVIKIEEGCFDMLHSKVFGHSPPSVNSFEQYVTSHFLLRKLKLYQKFHLIQRAEKKMRKSAIVSSQNEKQESGTILINIQDYNHFAKCDLRQLLLQMVSVFCQKGGQEESLKIRTLLRMFKFAFRVPYLQLLAEIIQTAKENLLCLLEEIPELLPYQHQFDKSYEPTGPSLYEGVWSDITPQQWETSLSNCSISTVFNKQNYEEFISSVWFKRNFLTLHDVVSKGQQEILQIHNQNKNQRTFYYFIAQIFESVEDSETLHSLISYLELQYPRLPQHLQGNIFLYRQLFNYLQSRGASMKNSVQLIICDFLALKDYEIFNLLFIHEKKHKNTLLKDIKQGIFNSEAACLSDGNSVFNIGLLNYFSSKLSEISDIKYLLNRLNNEKAEYHSKNQGMYEVIVKGMQAKLYIGTENDIPISEVFIYILNIPIQHEDSEIHKDKRYLEVIEKHSGILKSINIGMSVFEIIRSKQQVLSKLISYQTGLIANSQSQALEPSEFVHKTIQKMRQIDSIRKEIYFEEQISESSQNLIPFLFVINYLQTNGPCFEKIKALLKSQDLLASYPNFNEVDRQNVVLFLYKWKYSQIPTYCDKSQFVTGIAKLLPEANNVRALIEAELELTISLSCTQNQIKYPIGGTNAILSTVELEQAVNSLSGTQILGIDFERVFQLSSTIQRIASDGKVQSITLYQIYEIVILRLIECGMLKQSIQKIIKLIEISPIKDYNFIYPSILASKFSYELCEENRGLLLRIIARRFYSPQELLSLVEQLLSTKLSSQEQRILLKAEYSRVEFNLTFNPENELFSQQLKSEESKTKFGGILDSNLARLLSQSDEFSRTVDYPIILAILCNCPYGIVKYLYCKRYEINFKGVRCLLSKLFKKSFCDPSKVLQLGKRTFTILYQALTGDLYIEDVIQNFKAKQQLSDSMEISKLKPSSTVDDCVFRVMNKSIERFKAKIKQMRNFINKGNHRTEDADKEQLQDLAIEFQDSDNDFSSHELKLKKKSAQELQRSDFDKNFQIKFLLQRNSKEHISQYLSLQASMQEQKVFYQRKQESMSVKNSVIKLRNKKQQIETSHKMRISSSLKRIPSVGPIKMTISVPPKEVEQIQADNTGLQSVVKHRMHRTESVEYDPMQSLKLDSAEIGEKNQSPKKQLHPQPRNHFTKESTKRLQQVSEQLIKALRQKGSENIATSQPLKCLKLNSQQCKDLTRILYQSNDADLSESFAIIKRVSETEGVLTEKSSPINNLFLEIYTKMQHFQKKFSLELDLRQIFPVEGLFLNPQFKETMDLFEMVREPTINILNDNNVYKITKVMSLVFKSSQVQQEVNLAFLKNLIKHYEDSVELTPCEGENLKEQQRQQQKIKGFVERISLQYLQSRDEELVQEAKREDTKSLVLEAILDIMIKKKNTSMADQFRKKWKI